RRNDECKTGIDPCEQASKVCAHRHAVEPDRLTALRADPSEHPAHIPHGLGEPMNDVDEVVRHELRARKTADAARPMQRCDREDDVQAERAMQPHRTESPKIHVWVAHPERVQTNDPWAILT